MVICLLSVCVLHSYNEEGFTVDTLAYFQRQFGNGCCASTAGCGTDYILMYILVALDNH